MKTTLVLMMVAVVSAGCGGDDEVPGDIDATANAPDADPSAPDADPSAPDADPSAPDAPAVFPDAGVSWVECGDTLCTPEEECCVTGGAGGATSECMEPGTCTGTSLECDGPEDCEGTEVCCGSGGGAQCAAAESCMVVVCHTDDDCPEASPECCSLQLSQVCTSFCPGG